MLFFGNAIRSRFSSLLQPWLQQEPDMDIELGLLTSNLRLKNLSLDPSALNHLIDGSSRLVFESVTVRNLDVLVAPLKFPAFSIEVSGVDVVLSLRDLERGRCFRGLQDLDDLREREMKSMLSLLDPEGVSLHETVSKISAINFPRNRIKTAAMKTILECCHLQAQDILFELQLPPMDDSNAFFFRVKELSVESERVDYSSLLRGLVDAVFVPYKESSFVLNGSSLEVDLKRKDRVSHIAYSREFITHFRFKNLLPININVHASQVQFSFTAVDLSVLLVVFDLPSSTEIKCARTGRELWNMAVWRIRCLKPNPCRSLWKLFMTAVIWLRHIHAYESLLLRLGYSSIDQFKLNVDRMTRDRSFSASIKHQMKVVSDLEKELPVEAIECAWRIARYRAAVCFDHGNLESMADIKSRSFMRILALVSFLWKITCQIYYSMMHSLFLLKNVLNYHREVDGASPPLQHIDSYTQRRFALDIEELSVTLSPERAAHDPKKGNLQSDVEQSELSLCSFRVVFRTLCLTYLAESISQSLCLVCRDLKIFSLLSGRRPSNSKIKPRQSFDRHRLEEDSESKVLLWSEPACYICPSEGVVDAMPLNSNIHTHILDRYIGEMWSDWMSSSNNVEEDNLEYFECPFLLGNVKSFLLDPYFHGSECGLSKCSLTVGKLNIDLEYMSLMSLALLLRQIHDSYNWITTNGRTEVLSHTSSISEEKTEVKWEDLCESYANKMKIGMLSMIPQKNMQIGVTIAGSSIQISMQGRRWQGSKENDVFISEGCSGCSLTIDIESVQVAVWPSKKSVIAALTGEPIFNEAATEYLWLLEPQPTDVQKAESNENFTSYGRIALGAYLKFNGVNAIIEDLAENCCSHVVGLLPIEMKSSFCRDYSHSFTTTVNALSMKINGTARGADALFYVDELRVFHQVFEDILSAVSCVSLSFDSISDVFLENLCRRNGVSAIRDVRGNLLAYEAKCKSLILKSTKFIVDVTLEFDTLDIIMDGSRGNHTIGSGRKANGASSSVSCQIISPTKYGKTMHAMVSLPKFGLGMSVQRSFIQISPEGGFLKVLFTVSGIRSIIFGSQSHTGKYSDVSEVRKLLHESVNCLYESYLSCCTFVISTGPHEGSVLSGRIMNTVDAYGPGGSQPSVTAETLDCPELIILQEGSEFQSGNNIAPIGLLQPASSCWFFVEIGLDELFILEPSRKDVIFGVHQANKFQTSLSIGKEFRTVSCEIQDGLFVLETAALATFIECFRAYILCITNFSNISSGRPYKTDITLMVKNEGLAGPSVGHSKEDFSGAGSLGSPLAACNTSLESKWKFLMNLSIGLSKLSLVLVAADGSGEISELALEADFHFMLELFNSRTKLLFNLSRLSIISQNVRAKSLHQTATGILVPHFESNLSDHSSPPAGCYQHSQSLQHTESILPVVGDAYPRGPSGTENEKFEGGVSGFYHLIPGSDIVKGITASITVEKAVPSNGSLPYQMNNDWVGSGSVSGFNLTITLSEIEMILALFTPFFGVSSRETRGNVKEKFGSRYQEQDSVSENTIPDGAVVAIKDLHQHMYFAVESVENKYRLVGAIHYSLAGERALFRVKYHKQWRWRRNVSWFSLISLHAKTNAGEPLRLNFRPGSDFVDVSSTDDTGWALWGRLSYKPESNEDDTYLESYNQLAQKAFYLVNKKNDCAVAFIDGLPEFVKKPGHPFKVKLFHDFSPMQEISCLNVPYTHIDRRSETDFGDSFSNVDNSLNFSPYINIRTGNITLTVLHEISEVNDKFPLLCGGVNGFQFNMLVTSSKTRLISTFTAAIHNHDSRENLWKEIVSPVEAFIFYRFRSYSLETIQRDVPVSFHFGMKQVDVSLTELSLDMILFSVGKLNLAGPYAVRSAVIFPSRCKVENLSGLTLLCHFDDNQEAIISGNESTYIFLRQRRVVEDQDPQNAISVSVQLADPGTCSTTPIHISLLDTQVFAWRTRIVSQKDSRTYPGPFIVVDTSKTAEDGVSLVVSPLVRIHNASGFPMKICFRRPQETEAESAFVLLPIGDTIDDSMAVFDALRLSGGSKKALMSFGLGNFLLSFRPELEEYPEKYKKPISVDWSEDITGGKAFHLTGIFDKLNYRFKRAFGVKSMKSSFSTVHCALSVEGQHISDVHFLIQTITRDVPISQPHNFGDTSHTEISPVALQKQKEIFVFPTVHVSNLLQSEIHVLLTESDPDLCTTTDCNLAGKQATIHCGSSTNLYANLSMMFFTVTLIEFNTKCKPVNSSDWVKKLRKQKTDVHYLDIELKFAGGKYVAYLRLSRGERGILVATVFTSYTLQNGTDLTLFCCESNQKPLSRERVERSGANLSPDLGCLLPPGSSRSWFLKSNKICIKLMEDRASETSMDLDSLSGFTELCLESQDESGVKRFAKLGVSLKPCLPKAADLSLVLSMVPRYVVSNESEYRIFIHQCYLENDSDGSVAIDSEQKAALLFWKETLKRREISFFDSIFKHHRNRNEDSLLFIQFSLEEAGWSWSGPVCVASLGRFFLKFKRSAVSHGYEANGVNVPARQLTRYAAVTIVGENSSLFLHFQMPLKFNLPYRIENCICDSSITYYQKDSSDMDTLESGKSVDYAWDDLNLPHKLVVQINQKSLSREINIDKVCAWKPFSKTRQSRVLALDTSFSKKSGQEKKTNFNELHGSGVLNVGYEVYPDGSTRVLRICYFAENYKDIKTIQPSLKIQFRISSFAMHLLEKENQDVGASRTSTFSTIVVARLRNISLDSVFTEQHKFNQIRVQALNVDEKWEGAPFASMIRRSPIDHTDMIGNVLYIVFNLNSTVSKVKQVQHAAIVLQPIDLNIDEETLMRLVPFWRTSLSDSSSQSQQYYFKHFEIHPIKIIASFLPGAPYSSYSSAQEALRSLLHNVIKIPTVKNLVVELNGVLLTHALVTTRQLIIKCAQHYSWYAIRAIYIAKGSSLLPPSFASIFDDSASSSLDVFFDPSSGLINFPGLTLGTFKFISKCINAKGFPGTKRYFGDLGQTMKTAGSNVLFAAITRISDNVVRGAETSGFSGMVSGFHQGILKCAMEPSLLGSAIMEGGPDRKIKLDRSPEADELYIEGYLQAMLDVMYKQEYLRVRLIHDQVLLKNLPPNSALINEIVEQVKSFLVSKELLKGDPSLISRPLPVHRSRVERDWKIGPTLLTLCEHLFVSFAIRFLRKRVARYTSGIKWKRKSEGEHRDIVLASSKEKQEPLGLRWGIGKFLLSGLVAYVDGRLCRSIPNAIVRRIVSGFLLSLLEKDDDK